MNRRAFVLGAAMVLLGNLVAVALRSYAEARSSRRTAPSELPWLLIANARGFAVATLGYDVDQRRVAYARRRPRACSSRSAVAAATSPLLLHAGAPPVVLVVALAATSQVAGLALWNRVAAAVAGRDARRMLPRAGRGGDGAAARSPASARAPLAYRLGGDVLPYLGAVVTAIVIALCDRAGAGARRRRRARRDGPAGDARGPRRRANRRLLSAMIAVARARGRSSRRSIDLQFVAALKGRYTGDTLAVAVALFYGGTNLVLLAAPGDRGAAHPRHAQPADDRRRSIRCS